ncbi:MAG TPA: DoxX family membrane protein [Panacibacter sp.]|nr:DoxX family membrane protein [Panacibacter sp.]
MKKSLIVIRWIVGLLFIFSGLIKANDPLGLSYKMQEFFEVWNLNSLNDYSLALSLVMNVFEVLAGVAVIIGWRMRLFSWLLLLLIIFFCFLTAYAYLTGNIKTCGCFGDCIPLTPLTSFIKDVILLILILVLFVNRNNIVSSLPMPLPQILLLACITGIAWMQSYALNHLPFKDCLPFRTGTNIIESMRVPTGAKPDSFALTFKYKKNGEIKEFDANSFPADFDSTYEFIDRYQKLVKKGSDAPAIADFSLQTMNGKDVTVSVLNQGNYYVMLLVNDFSNYAEWHNKEFDTLLSRLNAKHLPFVIVTSDKNKAAELFGTNKNIHILLSDGTVIKTAARVNPTYFIMQLANIKGKYSYRDMDKVLEQIGRVPVDEDYDESDAIDLFNETDTLP